MLWTLAAERLTIWLGSWNVLKAAHFSIVFYVSWEVSVMRNGAGQGTFSCVKSDDSHCHHQRMFYARFFVRATPLTEIASPSNRDRISALRMWKISMSTAAHKMEKNMVLAMCLEKSEAFNLTVLESLPLYWQAKIFLKNLSDLVLDCMVNREKQLGYPHYNYFLSFGTAAILIVRFFFFNYCNSCGETWVGRDTGKRKGNVFRGILV